MKEHGDDEEIDGKARGAAHPRGDENGDESFFGGADGAGGHDAGNGAGVGAEERQEGFTGEAGAGHDAVHEVGGAGHVAGAFEEADEEEQEDDLGKEDDDAADAADDAIDDEGAEVALGHGIFHPSCEQALEGLDPTHGDGGEGKDRPEDDEHDAEEDDPAVNGVQEKGVEAIGGGLLVDIGPPCGEGAEVADEGLAAGVGIGVGVFPDGLGGVGKRVAEGLFELDDAFSRVGLDGDDGDAEFFGEFLGIEAEAGFLGGIDHVQGEDAGKSAFDDLEDKREVAFEVRGIGDADDEVGLGMAGDAAFEGVDGDLFVRGTGAEGVTAGEVKDAEFVPVRGKGFACGEGNGDAGVVSDLLVGAGEGVEEGGFPGVRVPDKGNGAWRFVGHDAAVWRPQPAAETSTCSASSRLIARRVPQTEQRRLRPPASFRTRICSQNPRSRRRSQPGPLSMLMVTSHPTAT